MYFSPSFTADWNELFTTKCVSCGFPIEAGDRWVEALNNNYHSQCFNCTVSPRDYHILKVCRSYWFPQCFFSAAVQKEPGGPEVFRQGGEGVLPQPRQRLSKAEEENFKLLRVICLIYYFPMRRLYIFCRKKLIASSRLCSNTLQLNLN